VASFGIFTTYINIPKNELPDIIVNILNLTNIYGSIKKKLILICSTIVRQNCLHCNGMLYTQNEWVLRTHSYFLKYLSKTYNILGL
jgi:hypothetical protein